MINSLGVHEAKDDAIMLVGALDVPSPGRGRS